MLFKDYPYSWNHFPFHPPNEIYKDAPLCHNMFDPSNQTLQDNIVCPINVEDMPNKSSGLLLKIVFKYYIYVRYRIHFHTNLDFNTYSLMAYEIFEKSARPSIP